MAKILAEKKRVAKNTASSGGKMMMKNTRVAKTTAPSKSELTPIKNMNETKKKTNPKTKTLGATKKERY